MPEGWVRMWTDEGTEVCARADAGCAGSGGASLRAFFLGDVGADGLELLVYGVELREMSIEIDRG